MKPSVSKLLDLLNKPALLGWANKIGLEGIKLDEYRRDVMKKGTSIHNQIERFQRDKTPFINPVVQKRYIEFMKDKRILFFEEKIETEYFQGRLDIMFEWNGKFYICDFKSNHKKLYLENKLQLVAYRMAKSCDNLAIISVPDFTLIESNIEDFYSYEEILKSLSNIYKIKETINEYIYI
jgi:hypothetical protein